MIALFHTIGNYRNNRQLVSYDDIENMVLDGLNIKNACYNDMESGDKRLLESDDVPGILYWKMRPTRTEEYALGSIQTANRHNDNNNVRMYKYIFSEEQRRYNLLERLIMGKGHEECKTIVSIIFLRELVFSYTK
ncbi:MAG: hypothetical protein ACMXYL_03205 [Candidatus Woesearchaeota archaeon]